MSESAETALWAAMRALEEKAALQRLIADALGGNDRTSSRLRDQSSADDANARIIRDMIFHPGAEAEESQPRKRA